MIRSFIDFIHFLLILLIRTFQFSPDYVLIYQLFLVQSTSVLWGFDIECIWDFYNFSCLKKLCIAAKIIKSKNVRDGIIPHRKCVNVSGKFELEVEICQILYWTIAIEFNWRHIPTTPQRLHWLLPRDNTLLTQL